MLGPRETRTGAHDTCNKDTPTDCFDYSRTRPLSGTCHFTRLGYMIVFLKRAFKVWEWVEGNAPPEPLTIIFTARCSCVYFF